MRGAVVHTTCPPHHMYEKEEKEAKNTKYIHILFLRNCKVIKCQGNHSKHKEIVHCIKNIYQWYTHTNKQTNKQIHICYINTYLPTHDTHIIYMREWTTIFVKPSTTTTTTIYLFRHWAISKKRRRKESRSIDCFVF